MVNTVTLNPAVDKVLFLDEVVKGVTNRVKNIRLTMGGKGTHVSMNLSVMGLRSRAFGLAYGTTGRYITDTLEDWDIETWFAYREDAESRTNYLLVEEDGTSTLIAEKGVEPTGQDTKELIELIKREAQKGEILVLSGDTSNYPDPNINNRLIEELAPKELKIFIDASGETLRKSLEKSPFLIKPNQEELEMLLGRRLTCDKEVVVAIRELDTRYNIDAIAVSMGKEGSIVKMPDEGIYKTVSPSVSVVNTVGCGDCYLAGLLYGFDQNLGCEEILRYATGVSAAAAEEFLSVGFDKNRGRVLAEQVEVKRID